MIADRVWERYLNAFGVKHVGVIFRDAVSFLDLPHIIKVKVGVQIIQTSGKGNSRCYDKK